MRWRSFCSLSDVLGARWGRAGACCVCVALAGVMLAWETHAATIMQRLMSRRVAGLVVNLPVVSTPQMDRFELVAADGGGTYIWNSWGLHQPRITRHADGSVRLIYNVLNQAEGDSWRLMRKQGLDGGWVVEATAEKFDDAFLLRDAFTDRVHVLASPNSVRTIYSSPAFAPVPIPGEWHLLNNATRQYSGAGIGPDGTICFKNYQEIPSPTENARTRVVYVCGTSTRDGAWQWHAKLDREVGPRYAYDYVFPGALPGFGGFVATAQRDLHKFAAGWYSAADDYVFDGVRVYKSGYSSHAHWHQSEVVPAFAPSEGAPIAPVQRQVDAYVDSQNRIIVNYFKDDPNDPAARGLYVVVSDAEGNVLLHKKWDLPPYGHVRFIESDNNKYWLLWTGNDQAATRLHLYALTLATQPALDFQLAGFTDFTSVAAPQRARENVFLAVPRGGNQRSNFIDGMMVACGTPYPEACSGQDNIFYFRIRLPNARKPSLFSRWPWLF